jgi:ABC-type transport system substrate-binding protein
VGFLGKRNIILSSCLILSLFFIQSFSGYYLNVDSSSVPFFTLVLKGKNSEFRPDIMNIVQQHLARIGIDVEVYPLDIGTYYAEMDIFHDYDILHIGVGGGLDPDWSNMYGTNLSYDAIGYDTNVDWDEELQTGLNQWYLDEGIKIMPPNSPERINHYWEWQQYLMSDILPCFPAFVPIDYEGIWNNLIGYNMSEGLLNSWGKMSFSGTHHGQRDTSEIVIADDEWENLNPLFVWEHTNLYISTLTLDSLFDVDSNALIWPRLATSWTAINDTHIRLTIRPNIKWQTDPDGLFSDEFFDVDDVYFTYYCYKYISDDWQRYYWLEDMHKVDQYTIDFFIDSDPLTLETNEPFAPFYSFFLNGILPEHYLNQTQELDGVTPDITHNSWDKFSSNCFGTGLLDFQSYNEEVETTLEIFDDCWLLDPSVDKTDMNFEERFGDFSGGLDKLRIRVIPELYTAILEFELGRIDIVDISHHPDKRNLIKQNPNYNVQSGVANAFQLFCFNLREDRQYIGNRDPAPGDPSLTIGLAIRKAISHAINRNEINDIVFRNDYIVTDWPIQLAMSTWINPNIIRYNHDLDKAKQFMTIAGFDLDISHQTQGYEISFLILSAITTVFVIHRIKSNKKSNK